MRQVISISPTGVVSGLQVKPGKGLDLRQFGKAKIERASEIEWDMHEQGWIIGIRKGKYACRVIDTGLCEEVGYAPERLLGYTLSTALVVGEGYRLMFREYDDAVSAEIAVLDHIRATQGSEVL